MPEYPTYQESDRVYEALQQVRKVVAHPPPELQPFASEYMLGVRSAKGTGRYCFVLLRLNDNTGIVHGDRHETILALWPDGEQWLGQITRPDGVEVFDTPLLGDSPRQVLGGMINVVFEQVPAG